VPTSSVNLIRFLFSELYIRLNWLTFFFYLFSHLDTSVKSEDESLVFDAQESMSQSLTERFNRLPRLPSPTRQHGVTVR
jgi:hypothetical protein